MDSSTVVRPRTHPPGLRSIPRRANASMSQMLESRSGSSWCQPWDLGNEPTHKVTLRELRMSEMSSSAKARALAVETQIDVDTDILDGALHGIEEAIINPLREGMFQAVTATPCAMIIFGVSGDLTSRKLMPALYDLAMNSRLAEGFAIVGVSRRQWTDEQFRAEMRAAVGNTLRICRSPTSAGTPSPRGSSTSAAISTSWPCTTGSRPARRARPRAPHRGQPALLPRHPAQLLHHHHPQPRLARSGGAAGFL